MFLVKKFFFSLVSLFSLFTFFISNTSIEVKLKASDFEKYIGKPFKENDFSDKKFDNETKKVSFKITKITSSDEFKFSFYPQKNEQTITKNIFYNKYTLTIKIKKENENWTIKEGWVKTKQQSKWEYFKENYLMIILPLFVVPILSFIIFKFRKK